MKLALVAVLGLAGCIIPSLGLDGHACPCLDGYVCNEASNVCVIAEPDMAVDTMPKDMRSPDDLELPQTCVAQMSSGWTHTCALKKDGTVWCWGNNNAGQSGVSTVMTVPTPMEVPGVTNATSLAAGDSHTCAVVSGGAVSCWGFNDQGEVGDGNSMETGVLPTNAMGLTGATQVAAGNAHTCARMSNGTVACWGRNTEGELGLSDTSPRLVPTPVPSLSGVVEVAVGWEHSCALESGGSVVCWGDNTYGQLGNGAMMAGANPISNVQIISDAASITAAFFETCVIRRDTTVYCWGLNTHGELGDDTMMNRSSPVMTMTMTGTSALALGGYDTVGPLSHMCAAGTDDSVWCWGSNAFGEIGNGVTQDQLVPNRVMGLGLAALVSAGGRHSCAAIPGSPVSCWGANDVSQLGNGGTTSSLTPTPSLFTCP